MIEAEKYGIPVRLGDAPQNDTLKSIKGIVSPEIFNLKKISEGSLFLVWHPASSLSLCLYIYIMNIIVYVLLFLSISLSPSIFFSPSFSFSSYMHICIYTSPSLSLLHPLSLSLFPRSPPLSPILDVFRTRITS
jgi:hypothetical protein